MSAQRYSATGGNDPDPLDVTTPWRSVDPSTLTTSRLPAIRDGLPRRTVVALVAVVSIRVGDAADGPPIEELVADLNHLTHDDAAAHYGREQGCSFSAFTRETGPKQDRAAFEACMREMHVSEDWIGRHLGEFDAAVRPVAIVHWWLA